MIVQVGKSILFLAALTFPLWVATRFAINISRQRRNQQILLTREFILASFFLYIVFLAAITIVPLPMSRFRTPSSEDINLIPVLNLARCLVQKPAGIPEGRKFCLENILGNIVLFFPLGIMLPLVHDKFSSIWKVLILAMLVSSGIELLQLVSRGFGSYRSVDIDDVLLNTFGACVGCVGFAIVRRYASENDIS